MKNFCTLIFVWTVWFSVAAKAMDFSATITKWHNNHVGALSVTYDSYDVLSPAELRTQKFLIKNGIQMDYELVTWGMMEHRAKIEHMHRYMMPRGFQFFGHGHKHDLHDDYTKEYTLKSFSDCYDTMKKLGIEPIAYAYPGGSNKRQETRDALAEAGFLSGRGYNIEDHKDPYNIPYGKTKPEDWYNLKSLLVMDPWDGNTPEEDVAINNTKELLPFYRGAIKRHAWLILTYHSIGRSDWGKMNFEIFKNMMLASKKFDFWNASMNDITLYTYERDKAVLSTKWVNQNKLLLKIDDGLNDKLFNFPLTVKIKVPEELRKKQFFLLSRHGKRRVSVRADGHTLLHILPDNSWYLLSSSAQPAFLPSPVLKSKDAPYFKVFPGNASPNP